MFWCSIVLRINWKDVGRMKTTKKKQNKKNKNKTNKQQKNKQTNNNKKNNIKFVYHPSIGSFFFFFHLGFTARRDYFTHFEPSQSLGGAKTGDPREKPLDHPQTELDLSHVTRARLKSLAGKSPARDTMRHVIRQVACFKIVWIYMGFATCRLLLSVT